MALNAPGIGSGLDVKGILTQLMDVERRPLLTLARKEALFQGQLSVYGQIKSTLSSLQAAAQKLSSSGTTPAYKATSSDTGAYTATASSGAVAAAYAVTVTQLAQAQKILANGQTSGTAAIGSGAATTLTIEFGTISGGTFDSGTGTWSGASFTVNTAKAAVTVNIGSTNNTLEGIRDAINAANGGLTATIINDGAATPYRLALASKDTGVANSLKVTVAGDATLQGLLGYDPAGTQNLRQTQAAQNAQLTVDGVSVSRATNTVTDVVAGVTLTLLKSGTGATTLTLQRDSSVLRAALEGLVKAYNDLNKTVGDATAKKASLQGDAATLSIQRQVRSTLGATYGTGAYQALSHLGIAFQKDGSLAVDATKLQAALDAQYADVASFASALGTAVDTLARNFLGGSGLIASRTDGINRSINTIGARRGDLEQRLAAIEKRYRAQFTALDTMIASMNKTSAFLQQQLQNLPKINPDN